MRSNERTTAEANQLESMRQTASLLPALPFLAALACGGSTPPSESPSSGSAGASTKPDPATTESPSREDGPKGNTETSAQLGEATPKTAPAPAKTLPLAARPVPLSQDEQKEADKKCKPLIDAMTRAASKKEDSGSPADRLAQVLQNPPKMASGDLDRCKELLQKGLRAYLFAAFETEAKVILKRLGQGIVMAYQSHGTLCPSAKPVPPDAQKVAAGPYIATEADWGSAGWECLGFAMPDQPMRFQYEVKTDPKAGTFEMIARGSPERDGKFIVVVSKGAVKDGKIEISNPVGQ